RHKRVIIALTAAQSAKTAVPASVCHKNWVNTPCMIAEAVPAAPRLVPRVFAPRREVHRNKRVARQEIARQKIARQKIAQQRVAQQQVAEQKVVRVAVRIAKVCTGNWVNAACAAP